MVTALAQYRMDEDMSGGCKDLRTGQSFIFLQANNPKHAARAKMEWSRSKHF